MQVRNLDEGAELESVAQTEGPLLSLAEAAPMGILLDGPARARGVRQPGRPRAARAVGEGDDLTGWRERIKPDAPARRSTRWSIDGLAGAPTGHAPPSPFDPTDGRRTWFRVRVAPHLGAAATRSSA